jgi:starch phosphorylase
MNEGHSAFLTLELIQERRRANGRRPLTPEDIQAIRSQCVFTTHTPVPAGHDVYPTQQIQAALGRETTHDLKDILDFDGELNMTLLALHLSGYVNGVARKHGYVSRAMFPEFDIGWITNGVHPGSWVAPAMQAVFDRHLEGWREDNYNLRYAFGIPTSEIWKAHVKAKTELIQRVNRIAKTRLRPDTLTLGFARRMTAYKRPGLIFRDLDRLRRIAIGGGKFQIVYAGKAHPRDDKGKELIQLVQKSAAVLQSAVPIAFAPNYDLALGRLITSGVDVWLNTPIPPLEASGTSGMKAAVNGVPSLSIMDGWWIEGCIEGVTGWAIGERDRGLLADDDSVRDSASLYDLLEGTIIPLYYTNPEGFRAIMRNAIALNGSFFNTQRMMNEYVTKAYFR